ncbi:MAG: hypothetical protein ACUVS2_03470 [Candidatus Flexifilum sp.]|jgi:hypothetical protein
MKHLLIIPLLLAALLAFSPAHAQKEREEDIEQALIAIVASQPPFRDWLAGYPNWIGQGNDDDGDGIWYVEFYSAEWEEWLGWAGIDRATGMITESFIPAPLSDDEYARQLEAAYAYALSDREVLAWLDNQPDRWEMWEFFNRFDRVWELNFYWGIRTVMVLISFDEDTDQIYIDGIYDRNALDEQEAQDAARDRAVELAYSASEIWPALDGVDDWTTYVEWQSDAVWSVSFVAGGRARAFVLVDLDAQSILEVRVR